MNARKPNNVIVVEGCDGAGKSTLAAELVKDFEFELVHTGGPLKDRADFENREKNLGLLDPMARRLYDRVPYISDPVYAFLQCRDRIVTETDVGRFIYQVQPIIIFCRLGTSAEMLQHISMEKKAHKPPDYMEKVKASHPALVASYDKIFHDLKLNYRGALILHYNWKIDSYSSLKFAINSLIGGR